MKIKLPNIDEQQKIIFEESTKEAIAVLKKNLKAPRYPRQEEIDEDQYNRTHLLKEEEGWEAPDPDIIGAYFRHFQCHFSDYDTDRKLADLLGLSSDRRVREYKSGARKIPYAVWRNFLVLTGRAPQCVMEVKGYLG